MKPPPCHLSDPMKPNLNPIFALLLAGTQHYNISNESPKIVQYSLALTGALFTLWCSLYWLLLKSITDLLSCIHDHDQYNIWWFWPQKMLDFMHSMIYFTWIKSRNDYRLGVTKRWSISYEQATQQQRNQCQNFSRGHNFCHSIVDCSQIRKKWNI